VCDFRSADVALGGQGAPLVPIGDRLLFGGFDYCLNIGGFANISYENAGHRIAFDIAPANTVLNMFAMQAGKPFDENGAMAAAGKIIAPLLERLNQISYYQSPPPKSLGREWLEHAFLPILADFKNQHMHDLLRTLTEHTAQQIARATTNHGSGTSMLITGGGALNRYLISRIETHTKVRSELPSIKEIQYKEALIFALLGVLRIRGEHNCLSSVTGAARDHCSGCIYPGLS
jgi:anhydro-N-acetylmuramic acid kinase